MYSLKIGPHSDEQPKIEVELASIDNNIDYVPVTRCKYRRQSMKFMGKLMKFIESCEIFKTF